MGNTFFENFGFLGLLKIIGNKSAPEDVSRQPLYQNFCELESFNHCAAVGKMVILTSLPPPTEGIRHKQTSTQAHVKGRTNRCLGTGDLYVAERYVTQICAAPE